MRFNAPADVPQARYVIELMTRVYAELGYELLVQDFNHPNALIAANAGSLDGQLGRVASISNDYPNLRRVDFPLFKFKLQLVSFCRDCRYQDVNSLTIRSGYPVAEDYLAQHPTSAYVVKVKSAVAQLNLVMQQQVEAALLLDFHLKPHLAKLNLDKLQVTDLALVESFHFVHKRHDDLVPLLKDKLEELERAGVVAELKAKYQI
ncbi:hypothetical protein [Pseudoalteromonas 'SMAR']|uniref:hypothetical protein n=1 Tax=Pseudoalteromonas 'SMAR' TaxID=3416908 RepID=UPI003AF264E3